MSGRGAGRGHTNPIASEPGPPAVRARRVPPPPDRVKITAPIHGARLGRYWAEGHNGDDATASVACPSCGAGIGEECRYG